MFGSEVFLLNIHSRKFMAISSLRDITDKNRITPKRHLYRTPHSVY